MKLLLVGLGFSTGFVPMFQFFFNVPIPVLVTHSSFSFYIVTSKLSPFSDCCAGQVIEGQL